MRPEADFQTTEIADIVQLYLHNGCVLLRRFCDETALQDLRQNLDVVHQEIDQVHLYPHHLRERGLQQPQEYLFSDKHWRLLDAVFAGAGFRDLEGNVSRRMDPQGRTVGWQKPLPPHLDAFFHPQAFTVNFWLPLQPCGVTLPSLGVVCTPFGEVLRFTGYDPAGVWTDPEDPGCFWGTFRPDMKAMFKRNAAILNEFRTQFADDIWTPAYEFGDAMMSSNWTLHFTHSVEEMAGLRQNLELRFISTATLGQVLENRD
jgi:hypothetical protein